MPYLRKRRPEFSGVGLKGNDEILEIICDSLITLHDLHEHFIFVSQGCKISLFSSSKIFKKKLTQILKYSCDIYICIYIHIHVHEISLRKLSI